MAPSHGLSRRSFIRLTSSGALAGGALLPALIAACTSPAPPAGSPAPTSYSASARQAAGSLVLPTYTPLTSKPKPDLPSTGQGIDDGFINYPRNPVKAQPAEAPGAGGTVTYFGYGYYTPPSPLDQNRAWQEVNRQLNATVQPNVAAAQDYPTKLATLMAGNDLPDMMYMLDGVAAAPNVPRFMQTLCADLAPYLGGDNIKQYPNLAAIPEYAWRSAGSAIDGHLYTIPIPTSLTGIYTLFRNTDIWDAEIGANYVPTGADDFKRVLTQLNKPQENRWAIAAFATKSGADASYGLPSFASIFGAPNGWALDASGTLKRDRETEEYKAAVGFARDLVASGLFHPNQPTYNQNSARADFLSKKFVVTQASPGAPWADMWYRGLQQNPPMHSRPIPLFPVQPGGKLTHYQHQGFIGANAFKKATPERLQELLRIANWLAAPFGSQEHVLVNYGVPDLDYTLDQNGNPVPTDRGLQDSVYVGWTYIARPSVVLYNAGIPDYARIQQGVQQDLLSHGLADPTIGFYSDFAFGKGRSVDQAFVDGVNDVIANRRPLSDYDGLVKDWVTSGGEQMRKEFMQSIAAAKA
jgi:putative aldouronate transport system substrate-binding protein